MLSVACSSSSEPDTWSVSSIAAVVKIDPWQQVFGSPCDFTIGFVMIDNGEVSREKTPVAGDTQKCATSW